MDLGILAHTLPGQAEALTDTLLRGEDLDTTVSLDGKWSRTWNKWRTDNANTLYQKGYRPCGLGFPLILRELEDGTWEAAPLFIWWLDLEPDPMRVDYWRLRHSAGSGGLINPVLLAKMNRSGREELPSWQDWLNFQKGHPGTGEALDAFCAHLGFEVSGKSSGLIPIQDPGAEETPPLQTGMRRSGLMGLFPRPLPFVREARLEDFLTDARVDPPSHSFGPLLPTPSQARAIRLLSVAQAARVTGSSGAGKTELLYDRALHALSLDWKCLVICPDPVRLRSFRQKLEATGLQNVCFFGHDPLADEANLNQKLQALLEASSSKEEPNWPDGGALETAKTALHALEETRQALSRKFFGSKSWQDCVAILLEASRIPGAKRMDPGSVPNLGLTWEEYQNLRHVIDRGSKLFPEIGRFDHPMSRLHADLFLQYDLLSSEERVREQLLGQLGQFRSLEQDLHAMRAQYAETLDQHYTTWYKSLAIPLFDLNELIDQYTDEFGKDFTLSSWLSLRVVGFFWKRYRELRQVKEQVFEAYRGLALRHGELNYFPFDFPEYQRGNELPKLRATLAAFSEALAEWREGLPPRLEEAVTVLSSQRIHPAAGMEVQVEDLEEKYANAALALNESGLFPDRFPPDLSQAEDQALQVNEVVRDLEQVAFAIDPFEPFYKWQRFWLSLDASARTLIKAVFDSGAEAWVPTFDLWYLTQVLEKEENPSLPGPGWSPGSYTKKWDHWRRGLPAYLDEYWKAVRTAFLEAERKEKPGSTSFLANLARSLRKDEPERKPSELLSRRQLVGLLPLWVMTPESAAAFFSVEANKGIFDLLLYDDAQDIPLAAGQGLLPLGKRQFLFGDPDDSTPSPQDSLLSVAENYPCSQIELDGVLPPERPKQPTRKIRVYRTSGLYDPDQGSNEAEIDALLELLTQVGPIAGPVAVICWTQGQRDRVMTRLRVMVERQLSGAGSIKALLEGGLHIYHLGETVAGDVEHLILSTCFGPETEDGEISPQIACLDQDDWRNLQKKFLATQEGRISMLSSLPKSWSPSPGTGQGDLARFMEQAEDPEEPVPDSDGDPGSRAPKIPVFPATPLSLAVLKMLEPHLEGNSMTFSPAADIPLRFFAEAGKDRPACLLTLDGTLGPVEWTDFAWEAHAITAFQAEGMTVLPVWSGSWWRDPETSAKRLARDINEVFSKLRDSRK